MKRCLLIIILCLFSSASLAQRGAIEQRDKLVKQYRDCVALVSIGLSGENHSVAEQAFSACATEEEALRVWFALMQVPASIAHTFILQRKLELKRMILKDPPH